jgi:hypothetical protein
MNGDKWSKQEKAVARRAFETAYEKECGEIINKIQEMAKKASDPDEIWQLHDFLNTKRREIDDKYDFRYSMLILVFARLLKERWIDTQDLEGLREDKITKIKELARV